MMTRPSFPTERPLPGGAAFFALLLALHLLPAGRLHALEPRTWISLDGRTLDAELVKTEGDVVLLKDKTGTTLKVPKASLSFGDLDYIAEFAPEEKTSGFAPKPSGKVKVPSPAKEMKFNNKSIVKDAGEIKLGGLAFRHAETPHFKVLYSKGFDPSDTAELAERLWHDTAFFHASFAGKFKDRRMAIVLADNANEFPKLGEWYTEIITATGNTEAATATRNAWPKLSSTSITLPAETADQNGLLTSATIIRSAGRGAKPGDGDNAKGVWASFRTHVLAGDLMGVQAGGVSSFAKEGLFAIFTGHSYYKEIDLTGASATGVLQSDTGKKASGAAGYDTGKNWAAELKRRIRKNDIKPNLTTLFASSRNDAKPDDLALAYSFSRFLQSTPERHTAYGKLMERISTSKQVPDPDTMAKIYGLEDAAGLEKAWLAFIDSGDFR